MAGGCLGGRSQLGAAQPRVDLAGGPLAVPDPDGDRALGGHHVAAGEHARGSRSSATPDTRDRAVGARTPRPGTARRNAVSVSWPSARITRVGGERLEPPGRLREAGLVELHHLDLQLLALERGDRPQPVDPHPLALGVLRPPPRAPASARGCAGRRSAPPRRPAAAPSGRRPSPCCRRRRPRPGGRSPAARPTPPRAGTTPRPRSGPRPRAGMSTRLDRCAPTATNTASKPPSRRSASRSVDPVVAGDPHAERRDPVDLRRRARRGAAGRRGSRSASSRPARRRRRGSRPRDPAAPGGRRPTARSARRRSPAPACRCAAAADRTASRAPAPDRRGTARPRGSRPRCRAWRGCSSLSHGW